ncbi:TCR/Tet family MFS transporter [Fibrella aquatilis]|uniref:TCR/Tet family MFS transporter n=1 Tax=Fibrella aquatilis TaxID=2817059 RepID=A0A939G9V9_9BACT|nr:TCR/Tet family MFS transporter [Fibrella aquatilis]MBO0932985.1 TCR/Tet family MFS transporter [Fibrella aquatilis]
MLSTSPTPSPTTTSFTKLTAMPSPKHYRLLILFAVVVIDVMGAGLIIPVLPDLVQHHLGTTTANASVYGAALLIAYSVMQFVFSPIIGRLSDRYGRRPVILASLAGFSLDYVVMAFAPSYAWLFVGRCVAGITGASMTTAFAYVADISTSAHRARNFGVIGAAIGLGFILGPVLGGFLGQIDLQYPFLAASGLALVNAVAAYFFLPESLVTPLRQPSRLALTNPLGPLLRPALMGLAAALFCIQMAEQTLPSTWVYYTKLAFGWGQQQVGWSMGFAGLLIVGVQGVLVRVVVPRWGELAAITWGCLAWAVAAFVFPFVVQVGWVYALMLPYAFGGIVTPSLQALLSQRTDAAQQGTLQGSLSALTSLTAVVGPLLATGLFSYFAARSAYHFPGAPFVSAGGLVLAGGLLAWHSLRRHQPSPMAAPVATATANATDTTNLATAPPAEAELDLVA